MKLLNEKHMKMLNDKVFEVVKRKIYEYIKRKPYEVVKRKTGGQEQKDRPHRPSGFFWKENRLSDSLPPKKNDQTGA